MTGSSRPLASSDAVRDRMREQRRRDTAAEMRIRRLLHAVGIRYRVDVKLEPDMRTRGDIVWRGLLLVVFVDGCFWHGCPVHATRPKSNADWWAEKLDANVRRDRATDAELRSRGWTVLRFWEHDPPDDAVRTIRCSLSNLRGRV
ncbi:very short patch repair endonuclease [Williamsia limnetica]|uniref:very short patch repair endonuclease n=1 Tax=Williamsia limnetica TaxID=882452 RepID=UPI001B86EC3E